MQGRELGSDGGNVEGSGGVPPSCGPEDIRDVNLASRGGGMGVVICVGGIVGIMDVAYEGMHSEAAGYHCGIYREPPI